MSEFAVYKGDALLCIGTAEECADELGIKPETVRFYATPSWRRRAAEMQTGSRGWFRVAERIEGERDA